MPNKFGRSVPVERFDPKGVVADGLPDVARPSGAAFAEAAAASDKVASTIGEIADRAAKVEGAAAGAVAGNDEGFRPTHSSSIRGQAYDTEATKVYLQNLDARMLTDLQTVYAENKDDPAKLNSALGDLHARMSASDVFSEVQGHFNKSFATHANAFRRAAELHAEARAKDELRAQSIVNLSNIQTYVRQATATLDPNDPAAEAAIADGVTRAEGVLRNLGNNNATPKATVESQVLGLRNEAYGGIVLQRAAKLTKPDEIAAFRTQFEKDFAAGKYNGKLDGDGYDRVYGNLAKMEASVATGARTQNAAVKKGFDDYVQREAAGLNPTADEWNTLVASANALPDGARMVAQAQAKRSVAAQLTGASVLQGDAIVQKLRDKAREDGGSADHAEIINFATKFVNDEKTGLRTDQLGFAQKKGLIATVTPVDLESFASADGPAAAEKLAGEIRARVSQADAVGQQFERLPQYFRPEEAARLKEIVDQGGDRALSLAAAIVRGGGDAAPAMLHQIAPDAPKLAQIGAVMLDGGSLTAMRDALTPSHLEKTKGAKFKALPDGVTAPTASTTLGQAFQWAPNVGLRVREVAEQIALTRMMRENVAASDDPARAKEIYGRALKEATGAVFVNDRQYGGVAKYSPPSWYFGSAKVITPPGVAADRFSSLIGAITDADLKALPEPPVRPDGKSYSARDFHDTIPVRAGNGYAFAKKNYVSGGDMEFIVGRNGRPYVLDWAAVEPTLRQRQPDLFIGAR